MYKALLIQRKALGSKLQLLTSSSLKFAKLTKFSSRTIEWHNKQIYQNISLFCIQAH